MGLFFKFKAGMVNFKLLAPYGIFGNQQAKGEDGSWAIGKRMYEDRLNQYSAEILSGLEGIQELYGGRTLVLLCFENVHKLGEDSCHRRWAAHWFQLVHGIEVPELGNYPLTV